MTPDQERRARNALISGFCAAACLWMAIGAGVLKAWEMWQ